LKEGYFYNFISYFFNIYR